MVNRFPTPLRHRWTVCLILLVATIVGGYLVYPIPLETVASLLIVDDGEEHTGMMVLLNGDFTDRPKKAAELFHAGVSPQILIGQVRLDPAEAAGFIPDRTELQVRLLELYGVPRTAVVVLQEEHGVDATVDEAIVVRRYLAERHYEGAITVVTGAFHARRARWIFRRVLRDTGIAVRLVAAPESDFDASNWWTVEDGLITVNNEFMKLGFYFLKYGLGGWP